MSAILPVITRISNGAARSVPMYSSLILWLRTIVPAAKPVTFQAVMDGDLMPFVEAYLRSQQKKV